jgi:probable HAF family extracellular repeat protein
MYLKNLFRVAIPVVGLLLANAVSAQATSVITFDQGWEGWNASGSNTTIVSTGGNPGSHASTDENLYDLAYWVDDIMSTGSPFIGNLAQHESITFSVDVKVQSIAVNGTEVTRPLIIGFRKFGSNASVWHVLGELHAGQEWTTYSVTVDPRSTSLPQGWGGTGADDPDTGGPVLPNGVTFASVMADVNETALYGTIPYQSNDAADFKVRIDNLRIVHGSKPAGVKPPHYEIVDLGDFGGELANAYAINDSGTVVGVAMNAGWLELPFIWRNGVMSYLGSLRPGIVDFGAARAISANGNVAGYGMAPDPVNPQFSVGHAFFWSEEGGMIDLTPNTSNMSVAWGVNSAGQVVGQYIGAFLWTAKDGMTNIALPDGDGGGQAEKISENGLITGWEWTVSNELAGWVYDTANGTMRKLPALGTLARSQTRDINTSGNVVGFSRSTDGYGRPVMWKADNTIVDLGFMPIPDYSQGVANAINDVNWIVGRDDYDGWSETPNRGWLWIDGSKYELKSLIVDPIIRDQWDELAHPLGINNRGEIVGIGIHNGVMGRAFLMRPLVPDTDTIFRNGFEAN